MANFTCCQLLPYQQHASCCIKPSLGSCKCSQAACNLRRGDQLTYKPKMNSHRTGGPVRSASELRAVTTLLLLSAVALGRA